MKRYGHEKQALHSVLVRLGLAPCSWPRQASVGARQERALIAGVCRRLLNQAPTYTT